MSARHRILEQRNDLADGWLRVLDRECGDDIYRFAHHVLVAQRQFHSAAPAPRGEVLIPRAAITRETVIDGKRVSLTVCRDPQYLLFEEIR